MCQVPALELEALERRIRGLNPFAELRRCNHADVDVRSLLGRKAFDLQRVANTLIGAGLDEVGFQRDPNALGIGNWETGRSVCVVQDEDDGAHGHSHSHGHGHGHSHGGDAGASISLSLAWSLENGKCPPTDCLTPRRVLQSCTLRTTHR